MHGSPRAAEPPSTESRTAVQRLIYALCWWATCVVMVLLFRLRRFQCDRIPESGSLLVVANHQSHLDPPLVAMCFRRRQLHFLARASLFRNPWFGRLISTLNAIPLQDATGDLTAIRTVLDALSRGHAVLMFPEGSRSPDGAMHEFKRGAALLVRRAKCRVLPVAVEGAFDAWPRHRALPRLLGRRIAVMVGRPIEHAELMQYGPDEALRRLADEIDRMRLELRRKLRAASAGRYPPRGPGDEKVRASGEHRAAARPAGTAAIESRSM